MILSSVVGALALLSSLIPFTHAAVNQLQQVSNFGTNPKNVGMFVYRPPNVQARPALVVAIHYCHGNAAEFFRNSQYANIADQKGFIVIFPNAPSSDGCFDVASAQTLKHGAGGDSQGIASMVQYAINNYNVDSSRVFVTGVSSGAMMTNVMIGSYPELFKAASAYAGVPFGCFAGTNSWNSQCANGQIIKTAQQWGDLVRAAYSGYNGPRPKFQFWHGTGDATLRYQNFNEEIKQWTNVFGLSQSPSTTTTNSPRSGVTKTTYGDKVFAYSIQGGSHDIPVDAAADIAFFGL